MFKISDLSNKDIINLDEGKRQGIISDVEIDLTEGKIKSIILSNTGKFLGIFSKREEQIISWENIHKIGEDVVLIKGQNRPDFREEKPIKSKDLA